MLDAHVIHPVVIDDAAQAVAEFRQAATQLSQSHTLASPALLSAWESNAGGLARQSIEELQLHLRGAAQQLDNLVVLASRHLAAVQQAAASAPQAVGVGTW